VKTETTYRVEYDSNNSGGGWWLDDEDWRKLEVAGWTVNWGGLDFCNARYPGIGGGPHTAPDTHKQDKCPGHRRFTSYDEAMASGYRWLGSLARDAWIEVKGYSPSLAEETARVLWSEDIGGKYDGHSFWARELKDLS